MEQKQIFQKRAGTTDRGTDYEHLYIAHLVLKLTLEEQIENFYLSSNDKNYGSFDDVVLIVKYRDKKETEVYAVQLKQSKNKVLRSSDLTKTKGNFSITQYLHNFNTNLKNLENVKMILYTNRKAQISNEVDLVFDNAKFKIAVLTLTQNTNLLETSKGVCYNFDSSKHEHFFRNFFLYTGQADVYQIEEKLLQIFRNSFSSDEAVFKEYVNFITKWSMKEGNKEKLDKNWMQQVIALEVLSPFIKTLSFSEEYNENSEMFKDAVSKFQITVLSKDSYDKVKNLWHDFQIEDFDVVNQVRTKFQIRLEKITVNEDLKNEDKETSKLFWLMGKSPLLVKDCPQIGKVMKFCQKGLIIFSSAKTVFDSSFQKLSDLKLDGPLFSKIVKNFTYSIENQKEASLETLIRLDDKVATMISTDNLVKMMYNPLPIGTQKEMLLPYHMPRTLSKILIHPQFLEELENTLILITEVQDVTTFKETLKDVNIIEVRRGTKIEPCVTLEKAIYVSKDEYNQKDFDTFCPNFHHQVKYLSSQCLEWVRSRNSVADLEKFQLNHNEHTIQESELLGNSENSINLVCGNSGMGKSTLMKSLKIGSCSSVWTILVYVRNHALQLRQKNKFLEYLLNDKCKGCDTVGRQILKIFGDTNRVRLIWDGLDEVSDESLDDILNMISAIAEKGIKQWVTARNNLKLLLERRFKTLSRHISHFSIQQQKMYIGKRLEMSDDEVYGIFNQIKTNVQPFSNSDILGIPLQIYMLTELFRRNQKKYSDLFTDIFTMLDLYENFVEEKFLLYYREKIKFDLSIEQNYQKYREEMKNRISCYKKVAFNLYIKSISSSDSFLEEIKKNGDCIGFISTESKENVEFCHNSFGEYFAALYLFDNSPQKSKERKFIWDQKLNNVRFFLDLKLAQNSRGHIAILYKNSNLLDKCGDEDLKSRDQIGRSILEIACAWSKNYKVLDFDENLEGQFSFKHKYMADDDSTTKLSFKDLSKYFKESDKMDIRVRKLLLLLPSFIPLYNKSSKNFDQKTAASILYYSIKFDYVVIFRYLNEIQWLQKAYQNFETKCLLSFAMTCKSRQVLEEIVANKHNVDLLHQNLTIILNTCKSEFDEVFTLLVKNCVNIDELLYIACCQGRVDNVQFLLQKGVTVDITDDCGRTPLHYACDNEKFGFQIVNLLLESGAEVNRPDQYGQMPLHYACVNNFETVSLLVDKGANINALDVNKRAPVHYACDNEDDGYRTVQLLVAKGVNLDITDVTGRMPVHYACMNVKFGFSLVKLMGDITTADANGRMPVHYACKNYVYGFDFLQLMIEKKIDVNTTDEEGCAPIHYACEKGMAKTVLLLVTNGALVNGVDKYGQRPLHYACRNFSDGYEIVNTLLDLEVPINHSDGHGCTPLHYACKNGKCKTVQLLLQHDCTLDPDCNGRLPIHYACQNEDFGYDIVKLLISKGTTVDICDADGKTTLHIACKHSNSYVVKILIDKMGKIDIPDKKGLLPLHHACTNWNYGFEIVQLLGGGTNIVTRDAKGKTPMHYACETGNLRTVSLLLEMGARLDVEDGDGHLPIEYAQRARNFNVVRFLARV